MGRPVGCVHPLDQSSTLCGSRSPQYRQCPFKGCGLDIPYCEKHGGDERSLSEMAEHVAACRWRPRDPEVDDGP